MERINPYSFVVPNPEGIPVKVFANEQVRIEAKAVEELHSFLTLQKSIKAIEAHAPGHFESEAGIVQVSISPDFHKAAGIPVGTAALTKGFVAPQAIGKDVNCGMRLLLSDWSEGDIRAALPALAKKIRHVYFEGGRGIALDRTQKTALLQHGLEGLVAEAPRHQDKGLWQQFEVEAEWADLEKVMGRGSLHTSGVFPGLHNYIDHAQVAWDSQLGSIGGGNHFVEVQRVEEILDGATAYAWGLKQGQVVIMVHSGCVSIGHPVSTYLMELLHQLYPAGLAFPENGIFPLPTGGRFEAAFQAYQMALFNAANFAFANRLFLGLMMRACLRSVVGPGTTRLLYDAGHNMVEELPSPDGPLFLHRKGATPARGPEAMEPGPFEWTGEPVLIPGSMGSDSYLMAGCGSADALSSASHGAGRSLSRGQALKGHADDLKQFLKDFHIITPIDPQDPKLRGRQDILRKWEEGILEEAPWAFKAVGPVVDTQVAAGIVRPVARLSPIFTVKG